MRLLCEGWSSDGIINILISNEGKTSKYEYTVDAALIPGWVRRIPYEPGKVLNEIKNNATLTIKL